MAVADVMPEHPPGPPEKPKCHVCGAVFSIVVQRCVNGHGRYHGKRCSQCDTDFLSSKCLLDHPEAIVQQINRSDA